MLARTLAIALLAFTLLCIGCTEPEPEYEASVVKFDERLLGTWMFAKGDDVVKITVSGRGRNIVNGRVVAEAIEGERKKNPPPERNAYVIAIEADVKSNQKGGGAPEVEHIRIELKGVAISVDGVTMLAAQPSAEQLGMSHLGGLVIPVHQLVRYELAGDTMTVQATASRLAWLPDVEWLDRPGDLSEVPTLPSKTSKLIVTNDVDRLVHVIRANMKHDGFWDQEMLVLTRVK